MKIGNLVRHRYLYNLGMVTDVKSPTGTYMIVLVKWFDTGIVKMESPSKLEVLA